MSLGPDSGVTAAIIVVKSVILVLGGLITYFGYKAYRRTGHDSIGVLAIGFGVMTFGALISGMFVQILGVGFNIGVLIYSTITALGLGIITYSMYNQTGARKETMKYMREEI